jgi:Flp pilus assembly protein TadB
VSDKGPGIERRAWSALLVLAGICLAGYLIQRWVLPLLPVAFALLTLWTLFRLLFRRR